MGVERREIVIIGAGPAGSAAAREAALMGLCPMLIEKDDSPGAHNACGGMVAYSFRNRLRLSYEVVEREIRRTILFIDGDQIEFDRGRPTYISFRRAFFDKFLAKQAVLAGAELFTSTHVMSVDPTSRRIMLKESLTGREREVLAQIIIFADGPKTLARDAFGIGHRPGPRTRHAMYWELDGPYGNGETMEIIVDTSAQTTGYFWVFPKRDRVQVGVGAPLHSGGSPLNERLTDFVQRNSELRGRRLLYKRAGLIPGERSQRLVADGAMVVGDAAGMVNPVTGGGIAYALLSGEMAGRIAASAVKAGRTDLKSLLRYPLHLHLTPHYLWLVAMTHWRRRLDRQDPVDRAPAYAKMLKRYFTFFHSLGRLVDILLG